MGQRQIAWITGAGGLIGNYLVQHAASMPSAWQVRGITREQLDLTDFSAVRRAFREESPALVIHCAALSKSTICQQDPALARKLNVEVTASLAELAAGIPFLFFSTDLVFDGLHGNYTESGKPNPLTVYAETKIAAEQIVLANPLHTVIRTSLNGGTSPTGDRAFNEEMRRAWRTGRTLKLFTDEFRSPIAATVTARAAWELAAQNRPGLYHLAGSERLSRWEIGQLVAARWPQTNARIVPGSVSEYPGPPRSPDTSLQCAKVQKLLSFALPGFTEWLAAHPAEPF